MKPFPEVFIELKATTYLPGEVGVFASRPIEKGEVILKESAGVIQSDFLLSPDVFSKQSPDIQARIRSFCVERPEGFYVADGMDFNDLPTSWYCNHSCEGNMGFTGDGDFVALRNIGKGEELAYDYGLVESGNFYLECKCGSAHCRKIIRGADHRDPEFKKKYAEYFYPDLR